MFKHRTATPLFFSNRVRKSSSGEFIPKPFNNNFLQRDIFATVLSPVFNISVQATCF